MSARKVMIRVPSLAFKWLAGCGFLLGRKPQLSSRGTQLLLKCAVHLLLNQRGHQTSVLASILSELSFSFFSPIQLFPVVGLQFHTILLRMGKLRCRQHFELIAGMCREVLYWWAHDITMSCDLEVTCLLIHLWMQHLRLHLEVLWKTERLHVASLALRRPSEVSGRP